MTFKNLGCFAIQKKMIEETPEDAAKIFACLNFIPINCKYSIRNGSYEYIGVSSQFSEISEGKRIPEYIILITEESDPNGNKTITSVTAQKLS